MQFVLQYLYNEQIMDSNLLWGIMIVSCWQAVQGEFWGCYAELKGPNGVAMMVEVAGTFNEAEQKLDSHAFQGLMEGVLHRE